MNCRVAGGLESGAAFNFVDIAVLILYLVTVVLYYAVGRTAEQQIL
jgi:hypothetical protein